MFRLFRAGWILVRTVSGELSDWRRRLQDTVKFLSLAASRCQPQSQSTAKNTRSTHTNTHTHNMSPLLLITYIFFFFFPLLLPKRKTLLNVFLVLFYLPFRERHGKIPTSQPGGIKKKEEKKSPPRKDFLFFT